MTDKYVTLNEISAELRISPETARRAVLDGRIRGIQVNGPHSVWRIEKRDYRAFLAKSRTDSGDAGTDDRAESNQDLVKTG